MISYFPNPMCQYKPDPDNLKLPSEPCPAGKYMLRDGSCKTCNRNYYSPAGSTRCYRCPDGKVSNYGSKSIDECEFGRYLQ